MYRIGFLVNKQMPMSRINERAIVWLTVLTN